MLRLQKAEKKGNYHYGHFDEYFTDSSRTAYFMYAGDTLAGFAMLCPYSNINQSPITRWQNLRFFRHFAENILHRKPQK